MPAVVRTADRVLAQTEGRDFITDFAPDMEEKPLAETIYPMDPQHAEAQFLRRFDALIKAREAESWPRLSNLPTNLPAFLKDR